MVNEQRYNVVYAGAVGEGFVEAQVKDNFVSHLKIPQDKVDQLFSGKRMTLKKSLVKAEAEKWQQKFLKIGAETVVVPFVETESKRVEKIRRVQQPKNPKTKKQAPLRKKNSVASQAEYDQELQANIRRAKAMIATQQFEQSFNNKKESNPIKRLVIFSAVLIGAMFVLYFYAGSFI